MLALAAALALCTGQCVWADQWPFPPSEYPSANGRFVLRVDASGPQLTLEEKAPGQTTVRWSVPYPETGAEHGDPAPVAVFITDDANHVVLRDVWGAVGEGNVLIFLGPRGNVLASYTLEQLLAHDEIYRYTLTVSSLWWSPRALFFFRPGQTQFAFVTRFGTIGLFDLATGERVPLSEGRRNGVRRDALDLARRALASREARAREIGATIAGALGDQPSVPRLEQLLDDPTSSATVGPPMYPLYEVQLAAGEALVALLGSKAAPLLEGKLTDANLQMARRWVGMLGTIRAARSSPGAKRLAQDRDATTRLTAVMAMLEGDDGSVIHANLHWLHDADERVRWHAIAALGDHPQPEDASALRAALQDPGVSCARRALQGLVRLNPPDLEEVLRASLRRGPSVAYWATLRLAERGDTEALKRIVDWVRTVETGPRENRGWGPYDVEEMCTLLIRARPPGTREALEAASQSRNAYVQCDGFGALAALGDGSALRRVRAFARSGDYLDRAHAINWLGVCRDRESRGFLEQQLSDRELVVREAAQKALEALH